MSPHPPLDDAYEPGRYCCSPAQGAHCGSRRNAPLAAPGPRARAVVRAARLATDTAGEVAALLLPLVAHVVGWRTDPAIMRRREPTGNDVSNSPDNAPPFTVAVPVV